MGLLSDCYIKRAKVAVFQMIPPTFRTGLEIRNFCLKYKMQVVTTYIWYYLQCVYLSKKKHSRHKPNWYELFFNIKRVKVTVFEMAPAFRTKPRVIKFGIKCKDYVIPTYL